MENPDHVAWRVLGKAVLDARIRRWVTRELRDVHWPTADTLAVFRALRALELDGAPVELQTLTEKLRLERPQDAPIGPACALFEEVTAADADWWIGRLCADARRRWFTELMARWEQAIGSGKPWGDLEPKILGEVRDYVADRRDRSTALTAPDLAEELALGFRAPGPAVGLATWDRMVGGLDPGEIHVLAGRPGRGKSSLGLRMLQGLARQGIGSLVVPLEMGAERSTLWLSEMGALHAEIRLMRRPDRRWSYLQADLHSHLEAFRPAVVLVDHLGYLRWFPPDRHMPRAEAVGEILRDLKGILEQHNAACLLICQLNRAVEGRRSARPTLADLRESGEIEQEAETVTFLWAEPKYARWSDIPGWLSIDKNRGGPPGDVPVTFSRATQAFAERELEEAKD